MAEIILELNFYSLFFIPDIILFAFPMALKKKSSATKCDGGAVFHPTIWLGISVLAAFSFYKSDEEFLGEQTVLCWNIGFSSSVKFRCVELTAWSILTFYVFGSFLKHRIRSEAHLRHSALAFAEVRVHVAAYTRSRDCLQGRGTSKCSGRWGHGSCLRTPGF